MKYGIALVFALLVFASRDAHAFGGKSYKLTELKHVTESQVAWSEETKKASVMIRGSAAELLFNMIEAKKAEQLGSDALALTKNMTNTHWTVNGKQVTCSRITNQKKSKSDYACGFELDEMGVVKGGVEPFNPQVFNLPRTTIAAKFFQKGATTRSLASATGATYGKSSAYVMHKKDEKAKEGKNALIVFKDEVARKLITVLGQGKDTKEFTKNGTKGWRGREIACVEAKNGNSERCALVLSLDDGGVSTYKNPLF